MGRRSRTREINYTCRHLKDEEGEEKARDSCCKLNLKVLLLHSKPMHSPEFKIVRFLVILHSGSQGSNEGPTDRMLFIQIRNFVEGC